MRVVGGKYKGRRFQPPKKFPSRPTTDFAKEALFNILENRFDLDEASVLDLFAGTGNISLEFISHGTKSVLSIDKHPLCHKFILNTLTDLGTTNWYCLKKDVFTFCSECNEKFDIIFADPPYGLKGVNALPELIFEHDLLAPEGLLIIEHGKEQQFGNKTHFVELRKYGGVHFSFFEVSDKSA